jgi:hypothetical protein
MMRHSVSRPAILSGVCLLAAAASAFGQPQSKRPQTDEELIAKLNELTRSKGDYIKRGIGPDFCRRLAVRPIGNCEAYRVTFTDNGRPAAVFYSLNDGKNGMLRTFITNLLDPNYADDYRVDIEGQLDRAVRRHGDASSHMSVKDAGPGFKRVVTFLRGKQDVLAGWPDATFSDDGSCPKGQVKRTARDPSLATCVKIDSSKAR